MSEWHQLSCVIYEVSEKPFVLETDLLVELLVIADLYMFFMLEGEAEGTHIATAYHRTQFDNMEACELYWGKRGDQLIEHLEEPLKAFWMQELNARTDDIYIESRAGCYDRSS